MKNCPYISSCDVKGQIEEPILPKNHYFNLKLIFFDKKITLNSVTFVQLIKNNGMITTHTNPFRAL